MTAVSVAIAPITLVFILGTVFGSFGNVLILRLPEGQSIMGRSRDMHTGHQLRWWELFPVLSFLFLRGRSRYSGKRLSFQYPFVEVLSGFLFVYAWMQHPVDLLAAALLALALWLLLLVAVIDSRTQSIPDLLNLPMVLCACLWALVTDQFAWLPLTIGVGFLGLQWLVSGGQWVGSGDIILIAGIALLLPDWKQLLLCLMLAYVIGSVIALSFIAFGHKSRRDPIAFAPFLVGASYITLLWGNTILWQLYGV